MRAIGSNIVTARYIGDKHVIGRYIGKQQVFGDYIHQGLIHHFDGHNNTGNGTFDPDADVWIDLVTGIQAILQNVSWQNYGVSFTSTASKVFYSGQNVQQYTIFNTHMITDFIGLHPRVFGENPYPTLYLNSNLNYPYSLFAQGKDAPFIPSIIPTQGSVMQAAIRFSGSETVDLFYNGILTANITDVVSYPSPVSTMYIGCREADDRTFTGKIYEHLVYNRALTDDEVYHNYLVSTQRY